MPKAVRRSVAARRVQARREQPTYVVSATPDLADIIDAEDAAAPIVQTGEAPVMPSSNVKLRVRMRGYDIGILADACQQVKEIAGITGARVAGPVMLPTKKKVYCVLRSPHVNKDAREHFEIRIHNRLLDLSNLSAQTVQALMEWVPPSGLEVDTRLV
jgi:small subunit ribosomal protein S10